MSESSRVRKRGHESMDRSESPSEVINKSIIERYLRDKKNEIDALRLMRLSLQTENAEMIERTGNHKRQRKIVDAIIDEQKPLQTAIMGGTTEDLVQYTLDSIKERSKDLQSMKRALQESIRNFLDGYSLKASDTATIEPLENRMKEGSRDLRTLLETAVSTFVGSKKKPQYFSVGMYFPPLIFGLVNVGILRLDPDRPDHACLALH